MQTLLLVGCGDIAQRAAPWLVKRFKVIALVRNPSLIPTWRNLGCTPILADLDNPKSLLRIRGIANLVLHLAPPPNASPTAGNKDTRTANLLHALGNLALMKGRSLPSRLVYVSTTGVYGDCQGALIDERRPVSPTTDRAKRRVDAETRLLAWGRANDSSVCILRAPGIYAADRLPLLRIQQALPTLHPDEDVFTNHIHADDLAMACCLALFRGSAGQIINVVDDSDMKMGDYFRSIADAFKLPHPPCLPRSQLEHALSPIQRSFMSESRRIQNHRLKQVLRLTLQYPTIFDTLHQLNPHPRNES
jgi:nucleoside-diphosphate-sugar epimerase